LQGDVDEIVLQTSTAGQATSYCDALQKLALPEKRTLSSHAVSMEQQSEGSRSASWWGCMQRPHKLQRGFTRGRASRDARWANVAYDPLRL